MTPMRRRILQGAGVVAAAAVAGGWWRASTQGVFARGTGPAYEPWSRWPPSGEPTPLTLVHAATLAASPHNTQPWLFRVREDVIELMVDADRHIGTIDPLRREQWMGVGCALENLTVAAPALGWNAAVAAVPDAAVPGLAARIALLRADAKPHPLYDAIARRHTHRGAYDPGRTLEDSLFSGMDALAEGLPDVAVRWLRAPAERDRAGEAIVAATEAIIADREQSTDSWRWFRADWQALQRHRDGITLDAAGMPPALLALVKMLPAMSMEASDAGWLDATRKVHVATAPAYGIVLAHDPRDPAQRLAGGRLWQRLHLWAAARGIGMQPLNQMPERADRETTTGIESRFGGLLAELVGNDAWKALMPFRLGYPLGEAMPSPRRAVEDVIVT